MMLGKGGSVPVDSLCIGDLRGLGAKTDDPVRIGGMAPSRDRLPPDIIGLGNFGRAGLVANMFCAIPANDACFASLS